MKSYGKKDLRLFAFVFSLILGLVSSGLSKAGSVAAAGMLLSLSMLMLAAGLFLPSAARPFYGLFSVFGKIIGFVAASLLLGVIFYCIFTPIGVLLRMTKKNILGLGCKTDMPSYWIERKDKVVGPEDLERQY